MQNRRGFLGSLLASGTLAATALPKINSPIKDEMKYKGFILLWTGWKEVPNQDILVGQWVSNLSGIGARLEDGGLFSASYPGAEGKYFPGQFFDTSFKETQTPVMRLHTEEQKEEFRLEALQRIMKVIDDYA
jgi:hypothetical protein